MSEATFHTTRQEIRKPESKVSRSHDGKTPADSDVSKMKSIIDQNTDKPAEIENTKANLPLPNQPPAASDWNSLDQRTTAVGSGRFELPLITVVSVRAPLLVAVPALMVRSYTRPLPLATILAARVLRDSTISPLTLGPVK
ncbi:uncharacterized protein N7446_012786 [Penicillium canescens]|uniref:uncharacterized protein n=1 Tax=Penicillium canescens TaxID=5083 RepID=UPI0026DF66D3|nr:uncharacterized protein N7446_012786 [Penicillium canescens]KAJ6026307.1 hypothetical protein N7444_013986 [Penicillium canescens]KAJ6041720.1 hypothetical protein N7446_012786 [Penicillium canescens]